MLIFACWINCQVDLTRGGPEVDLQQQKINTNQCHNLHIRKTYPMIPILPSPTFKPDILLCKLSKTLFYFRNLRAEHG